MSGCSPSAAAAAILVKKSVSALVESVAYIVSSASTAHLKSLRKRQALLFRSYRSALYGSILSPSSATSSARLRVPRLEEVLEELLAQLLVGRRDPQHLLEGHERVGRVVGRLILGRQRGPDRQAQRVALGRRLEVLHDLRARRLLVLGEQRQAVVGEPVVRHGLDGLAAPPRPPCPAWRSADPRRPSHRRATSTAGSSASASPLARRPRALARRCWVSATTLPASSFTPMRRAVTV